ncbi:MAG: N-acetylmuramoyl-L-alanine amidase [Chloroflexi bacterium]|nr:N-acetylmuramoyl-L-alanine amidase [Chloroflexota bacterium]
MASTVDIVRAVVRDMERAGVPIVYSGGWESRGRPYRFVPRGFTMHHTATNRNAAGEYPSLRLVRDGRSDLPGPLSQFGLGRTGTLIVIAAGYANHAGRGGWRGLSGNGSVWGCEWENDGIGEPVHPTARRNYALLGAALARHTGFGADMVHLHREWTSAKIDPTGFDGNESRRQVAALLAGGSPTPVPTPESEDDMVLIWHKGALYLLTARGRTPWGLQPHAADALKAAGIKVGGNPTDDQSNLFDAIDQTA